MEGRRWEETSEGVHYWFREIPEPLLGFNPQRYVYWEGTYTIGGSNEKGTRVVFYPKTAMVFDGELCSIREEWLNLDDEPTDIEYGALRSTYLSTIIDNLEGRGDKDTGGKYFEYSSMQDLMEMFDFNEVVMEMDNHEHGVNEMIKTGCPIYGNHPTYPDVVLLFHHKEAAIRELHAIMEKCTEHSITWLWL